LTTRARNALSRARAAAADHGIALVRVEDVLVGIGVQESVAGGVLQSLGVTAGMLSSLAYPDVTPT
ncbi:MAG TPA: hypothetical protein VK864_12265, partial [Longimicrobiales bacterium]|nr:hypothetical protein [Longimicrobiales bacterium]